MSDWDDFQNEMRLFGKVSDQDIERVLSGDPVEDAAWEDFASALREARGHLVGPPDELVRRSHKLAMAAATEALATETSQRAASLSRKSRQTFGRRFMRRSWVIGSRAVLAGGLLALSSLGLAYAGVDLPGSAAERAWQAVGLDLPNQGNDGETARADDVKAVIDSSEERGCEFGQDVAEAASDGKSAQDQAKDPCTAEENGDSEAEAQGSKATGEEKSAEGRAKAAEKSNGRSEAGADNAGSNDDAGRQTASEKSDGKSDGGADNAGSNDAATGGSGGETASEKSGGKSDAGPDNAGGGEETASEKAGGSAPDSPGSP